MSIEPKTFFPSMECEQREIIEIPEEYDKYVISELEDGQEYVGEPRMSDVMDFTIDEDGEEITKYRCKLFLVDTPNEEYLEININLKKEGDEQINVWKGSVLFDLLASIRELEEPHSMAGFNVIKKVNLKEFRDFVNGLASMKIQAIERKVKFEFTSFKVMAVKN